MSEEPRVMVATEGPVCTITMNRPEARNAIDDGMRTGLMAAINEAASNEQVRAVVLTGTGTAFCAGGDIAGMKARLSAPEDTKAIAGWRRQHQIHAMVKALHSIDKPTIAAVNGAAAGLGCDLALCCDFIVASEDANFIMSYVLRGLIPDGGGLYWLPRRVGLSLAKQLIYTGRTVPGKEAVAIGMADKLVSSGELLPTAQAWAAELAGYSASSIALSKAILDQTFELSADEAFALGAQAQAIAYTTGDHRASVEAFLSRRSTNPK